MVLSGRAGFLYSLCCYPAVLLRKDPRAEECFLKAAQALRRRCFPQAGIIQAWGDLEDPNNRGRIHSIPDRKEVVHSKFSYSAG